MIRTSVGVLRGGTSSEYTLSLKTGAAILSNLPDDKYETRDIFIGKDGTWHLRGIPVDPARALSQVDVVLSGLHGGVGEDGTVQRLLERAGVPYAGARPSPALNSLHKTRAHEILQKAGVRMPAAMGFSISDEMTTGEMARTIFNTFGPPYVVKPAQEGASTGILIASTPIELPDALAIILDMYGGALVEQFVRGEQATVGVIEDFRGEDLYALPPAHITLPEGEKLMRPDHHAGAKLTYSVPSSFDKSQKEMLANAAKDAHRALGLSHFSRADFIVTPRAAYLLEVNALPGLYQGAAFPPMLEAVGSSVREFLEHSIKLARAA